MTRKSRGGAPAFLLGVACGVGLTFFASAILVLIWPTGREAAKRYEESIERLLDGVVGMPESEAVAAVCARISLEACKRIGADPDPSHHVPDARGGERYYRLPYDRSLIVLAVDARGRVVRTAVSNRP